MAPDESLTHSRHLKGMPSPWNDSDCHICGRTIKRNTMLVLDSEGGLYCSYYCATVGYWLAVDSDLMSPRSVHESAPRYGTERGLCYECAKRDDLPPNVYLGRFVCVSCHRPFDVSMREAIRQVWAGEVDSPEGAGLEECERCNGYGSSLDDDQEEHCRACLGSGLRPMTLRHRVSWTFSQIKPRLTAALEAFVDEPE